MRRFVLALACLAPALSAPAAPNPDKLLRAAEQQLVRFEERNDTAALARARAAVDELTATGPGRARPEAWIVRARVYREIDGHDVEPGRKDHQWITRIEDPRALAEAAAIEAGTLLDRDEPARLSDRQVDWLRRLEQQSRLERSGDEAFFDEQDFAGALRYYRAAVGMKRVTEAEEDRASAAFPRKTRLLMKASDAALKQQQWPLAARYLELLVGREPTAAVYYHLQEVCRALGDDAKAQQYLAEGRVAHPRDLGLLFAEINLERSRQNWRPLVPLLVEAMQREPNNPGLQAALGQAHVALLTEATGRQDDDAAAAHAAEAGRVLEGLLQRDPGHREGLYFLGLVHFTLAHDLGRKLAALPTARSPEDDARAAGWSRRRDEAAQQALARLGALEALTPDDPNVLTLLAELHKLRGEEELARRYAARLERARATD